MDPHTYHPPAGSHHRAAVRGPGGFLKKDALVDWLYDNARMPAGEYWDYQLVQNYIYPRATFGRSRGRRLRRRRELIPMFRREDIHVVGSGARPGHWASGWRVQDSHAPVDAWR
jgi:hypothetical protein